MADLPKIADLMATYTQFADFAAMNRLDNKETESALAGISQAVAQLRAGEPVGH